MSSYAIYKKLLQQRVEDTREQLAEAELKLKHKQAAHNAALVEEKAFHEGMDELMSKCKKGVNMASHSDEMKQLFHLIQVVTGTELDKEGKKVIDSWMWEFVDRRCENYQKQLNELLVLDMPRRRGWVKK